jgi:hypothetical protein
MTDEHELRIASDGFLARVERLHELEGRKRELVPGSPEMVAATHEVEELARAVLASAERETELAAAAEVTGTTDMTPIAITPPREMDVVLEEWRAAERQLSAEAPGTASWETARADVDRLRAEYARAYQAHKR